MTPPPPPCGCAIQMDYCGLGKVLVPCIQYCPLHLAAHRLREALAFCLEYGDFEESCTDNKLASNCLDNARALLRSCDQGKGN